MAREILCQLWPQQRWLTSDWIVAGIARRTGESFSYQLAGCVFPSFAVATVIVPQLFRDHTTTIIWRNREVVAP